MLKLLLLALAIWLIVAMLRRHQHLRQPSSPPIKTGDMVQCSVCNVHLPETEAISAYGLHYCCEAHFLQRKKQP